MINVKIRMLANCKKFSTKFDSLLEEILVDEPYKYSDLYKKYYEYYKDIEYITKYKEGKPLLIMATSLGDVHYTENGMIVDYVMNDNIVFDEELLKSEQFIEFINKATVSLYKMCVIRLKFDKEINIDLYNMIDTLEIDIEIDIVSGDNTYNLSYTYDKWKKYNEGKN